MKLELMILLATAHPFSFALKNPMAPVVPKDLIPPAPLKCQIENIKPDCITITETLVVKSSDPGYITFLHYNKMPAIVFISGEEWHIVRVNVEEFPTNKKNFTILAHTDCKTNVISYKELEPDFILKVAILHEIFHAGVCSHDPRWWNSLDDTDDGHPGIYRLGPFVYTLLRDNPDLARWIISDN